MCRAIGFVTVCVLLCLCRGSSYSGAQAQKCAFQNCTAFYYSTVHQANVTFRYAWSFIGFPTLLMFYSNEPVRNDNCSCADGISVNIDEYDTSQTYGSVNISDAGRNVAFAVVFRQLIEIVVDANEAPSATDKANFSNGVNTSYHRFLLNNPLADLSFKDGNTINLIYSGSLSIINTISTSLLPGSLQRFPKTHYTENSTTFDMVVNNFPYKSNNSRIVLEMYFIPGPALESEGTTQITRSIDDEYTPSVFDTYTYSFGKSYLQWKPISYQDAGRKSTASQLTSYLTYQGLQPEDEGQLPQGLARAVFGPGANVTRFYLGIGTSGDPTYLSPNFFTWTTVAGYGTPPTENISTMAVIILCVGFGLPMATILLGTLYIIYKRKPWMYAVVLAAKVRTRNKSYAPIVNNN